MSKKNSQHTRFDAAIQRKGPYTQTPTQVLLFKEPNMYGELDQYTRRTEKDIPPVPLTPLELEYPELTPEQIAATKLPPEKQKHLEYELEQEIKERDRRAPYTYYGSYDSEISKYQKYLEDNKFPDVLKGKILVKYEELRNKSKEFYIAYREANQLASVEFEPNTNGTYGELFQEYATLVATELTKEIGKLFGVYTDINIKNLFDKGINIFNINSLNVSKKIEEMDSMIHNMDAILKDFYHRRKITNNIQKKLDEEIKELLSNSHYQKFLLWMDEYFPSYKDQFISESIQKIKSFGKSGKDDPIKLEDLVKFRTFKNIYEKSQLAVGHTFKTQIGDSLRTKIQEELESQIKNKIRVKVKITNDFLEHLTDLDTIKELQIASTYAQQTINFLRRTFGLDLRAIFTFATNVTSKAIEADNEFADEYKPSENDKLDAQNLINMAKRDFFKVFLTKLKSEILNMNKTGWDKYYSSLYNEIREFVNKIFAKHKHGYELEELEKIISINTKELDVLANKLLQSIVLEAIPGFKSPIRNYHTDREDAASPTIQRRFWGIKAILEETDGKFSIESFTNYIFRYLPFVPKEFILSSVKNLFKELDSKALNRMASLEGTDHQNAMKVVVNVLKRDGKLEHNNFLKVLKMQVYYAGIFTQIRINLPKGILEDKIIQIMEASVRSSQTMDKDLENLQEFSKLIHDEAGTLSDEIIQKMVSNKNFTNFSKIGIVKKIIRAYCQIKNNLGVEQIYKQYGELLKDLQERGLVGADFKENLMLIEKTFDKGEEFSPKSSNFADLFEAASKIESDLAVLKMGDALKDLTKDYQKKDDNLFKLDQNLNDSIRFRVLKDKDPLILRIGINTECCQRLGGVGESAARDSFINPLSSILILEWKDPENQEWKLLAQSYFHYVPKENGYILDNVEKNSKNVYEFQSQASMNLDEIYAIYAQQIKDKLNVSYFLSGKSFSKINAASFRSDKRYTDPRYFDDRALTKGQRDHYSDYDEKNSIDLLMPKINVQKALNRLERPAVRQARQQFTQFIKSILYPSSFIKQAQQATTNTTPITPKIVNREDVKTMPGVKTNLLGPQSWEYLNRFVNELNNGIFELGNQQKLGGQALNFQAIIRNPSASTRYVGGLKHLFEIATSLWHILTASRTEPYNITEVAEMVNKYLQYLNNSDFPEPEAVNIKSKLINILNNWLSILK